MIELGMSYPYSQEFVNLKLVFSTFSSNIRACQNLLQYAISVSLLISITGSPHSQIDSWKSLELSRNVRCSLKLSIIWISKGNEVSPSSLLQFEWSGNESNSILSILQDTSTSNTKSLAHSHRSRGQSSSLTQHRESRLRLSPMSISQ